jgi:DNA-binding Lrp family transcriptional regulator
MDELDQQITYILENQGLQTSKALAGIIGGASERTIRRHLNEMIKQHTIKIVTIPNPVLCGFTAWSKIGIKVDPIYLDHVANMLVEHSSVYFAAYSLGRFDIIIAVHFDTIDKLSHFVNSELLGMQGIVNLETWLLTCPRKYHRFSWNTPSFFGADEHYLSHEPKVDQSDFHIDDVDRDILALLIENGFMLPAEIKSKLGLGENTIRKRIQYMLNNNIFKKEVVLNPQILKNETWATFGITTNGRSAYGVIEDLINFNQVYLVSGSLGKFNVLIAGHFGNMEQLNDFVTKELPGINGISSTETFVHNKPLKYHNIPLENF